MTETIYTDQFFRDRASGSLQSARKILPFVSQMIDCQSVIDIGCGVGTWLSVFRELGVMDIRGVDGAYVRNEDLLIPLDCFAAADLSLPMQIERRFDLVVSLEVAEHLPSQRNDSFVGELTCISPVILFSASLPYQDGTGHINEQWLEYWVNLFANHDYIAIDCIRTRFWNDPEVDWWYKQNTVIYVRRDKLSTYPKLAALHEIAPFPPVSHVHPNFLAYKQSRLNMPLAELVPMTLTRILKALAKRLGLGSSLKRHDLP